MRTSFIHISVFIIISFFIGCANIVPPTGGEKDVKAPELLEVEPKDSLLNTRVTEIYLKFDEFVTLDNASKEIKVSPVIPFPITTTLNGKKVKLEIPDSLLNDNTTYRISFGNAIKDIHEGNAFKQYNYTFSTGAFFDSLKLSGKVTDAVTGNPNNDAYILLYDADENDSVVVREKPLYVSKVNNGTFVIPGLPNRAFRIYALKDKNENLIYDGEEEEIAFIDSFVTPMDSLDASIKLRLFKELSVIDTSLIDSFKKKTETNFKLQSDRERRGNKNKKIAAFKYTVGVDTSKLNKRTYDVNKSIAIKFSRDVDTYYINKVILSYENTKGDVSAEEFSIKRDTIDNVLRLYADWKENTVYSVGLKRGFAKDSLGTLSGISKHKFRTMSDEDYGKLNIHIPTAYYGQKYLLVVTNEKDTVHNAPITDTSIHLEKLNAGKYHFSIIIDENENGKWDTGNLFEMLQPEYVIPHSDVTELKAGWENVIDFVMPVTESEKKWKTSPQKRGRTSVK